MAKSKRTNQRNLQSHYRWNIFKRLRPKQPNPKSLRIRNVQYRRRLRKQLKQRIPPIPSNSQRLLRRSKIPTYVALDADYLTETTFQDLKTQAEETSRVIGRLRVSIDNQRTKK